MDPHSLMFAAGALLAAAGLASLPAAGAAAPGSGIRLRSSDKRLVEIFDWARASAARWVGSDSDPVGPWYEAALPGREAFCMRDVSHQCIGAEVLGLGKQNLNMMRRFVEGISEQRDFCSYWEIDRHNRPAPVDYESDDDFWYVLNANFDIIDACFRLFQWTGNPEYLRGEAFDRFYRLTLHEYIDRWQLQPGRIMSRPPQTNLKPTTVRFRQSRGIPSYDEQQGDLVVGSDLVGMIRNGFRTYAAILKLRKEPAGARAYARKADEYKQLLESQWWDERSQSYFAFHTADKQFLHGGIANSEFLLWCRAIDDPARIVKALRGIRNTQVEVLSYLPMLNYRYGFNREGYEALVEIHADPRREYPEASFGAIEGIACGLMGIEPDAAARLVVTCPRFTAATEWAEAADVAIFGATVSVMHASRVSTTFTNHSDKPITWRATFQGVHATAVANGRTRRAKHRSDAVGNPHSYVDVQVRPGRTVTVEAAPSSAS